MSRSVVRTVAFAAGSLLLAACGEQRLGTGTERDIIAPIVSIQKTAGDTMDVSQNLRFSVSATDNLGLKILSVQLTGGYTAQIDTTFSTAVTTFTRQIVVTFPRITSAGGWVYIRASAIDGNNNGIAAQDSIFLTNRDALLVTLVRPSPGTVTSLGKQILVQVDASQNNGVRKVGWTAQGPFTDADSVLFPAPLQDTVSFLDTLTVPGVVSGGSFTVIGFAEDSSGRRVSTPPITVTILSVAQDTTPPIVTFAVQTRVEVRDSISVRARDPSGITLVGWLATSRATGLVVGGDSTTSGGTLTDVAVTYNLNLSFTTFPQEIIITAFGVDAAGNRGVARQDTTQIAPVRADTIVVVNGITRRLPIGGRVADAIYNRNLNEIYFTNVELDRIEVYRIADTSFTASIPVGSRPWGLAMWPRDTLGNTSDTIIVANSGGTNLSIVDVALRRERRRHALPNFLIQSVQTEIDPATNAVKMKILEFDFSDRPEYVATSCRPTTGSVNCAADSIFAIFSTTPTIDQAGQFRLRGTLRWEQVGTGAVQSHFFWEHAAVAPSPDADTLQIIADHGPVLPADTVLAATCGVTVTMDELAFFDTTFVRNSGNFTHALIGEGGNLGERFARAIGYNGVAGIYKAACPTVIVQGVPFSGRIEADLGISPGIRVRDFIANTAIPIRSIGVNFNGLTNLIRADSVYVLDETLRLQGLVAVGGPNVGMDLNFDHAFNAQSAGTVTFGGPAPDANNRIVFMAREDAAIDVFDTFFYGRVATVPLRDPVTGPLRVAKLPTGEQVLVGVTARGVVVARLPPIANIFQAKAWGPPIPE